MIRIVTFLWRRGKTGYQLPGICDYTAKHVNILQNMLKRHLKVPHELICITDMPDGINCRTIPLWDKCQKLGGCFNRLYVFSQDMADIIGPRFATIDLDVVLTNDVTQIFTRAEPFLIHRYVGVFTEQKYNGALMIMDAGVHDHVWTDFDPETTPWVVLREREEGRRIGSDQAWISMCIPDAPLLGNEHGIYEAVRIEKKLPLDARMVFFSGKRDPSQLAHRWIRDHYY